MLYTEKQQCVGDADEYRLLRDTCLCCLPFGVAVGGALGVSRGLSVGVPAKQLNHYQGCVAAHRIEKRPYEVENVIYQQLSHWKMMKQGRRTEDALVALCVRACGAAIMTLTLRPQEKSLAGRARKDVTITKRQVGVNGRRRHLPEVCMMTTRTSDVGRVIVREHAGVDRRQRC